MIRHLRTKGLAPLLRAPAGTERERAITIARIILWARQTLTLDTGPFASGRWCPYATSETGVSIRWIESLQRVTIEANYLPLNRLLGETYPFNHIEASLPEGTDGLEIHCGRISDDRADVAVHENVFPSELPDDDWPQTAPGHFRFSDSEIDSRRTGVGAELSRMVWKVAPAIPLNPPNPGLPVHNHINVHRSVTINDGSVFCLKTRRVGSLIPPGGNVRRPKPLL